MELEFIELKWKYAFTKGNVFDREMEDYYLSIIYELVCIFGLYA
jgi:hypothetical protein